ncbi:MAG: hypothetical protein WCJ62_10730 [Flavobacterium sp.]
MKNYYYLLFRVYTYYYKRDKNDGNLALFTTTLISSLLILFLIFSGILFVNVFFNETFLISLIPNKFWMIFYLLIIISLNYILFIKKKEFLNLNFINDKRGGYIIIYSIIILALIFVFIANKNRDKIFKEREKARIENKQ